MVDDPNKEEKKDVEKIRSMLQEMADHNKPVAKEMVELKHVETKKQAVSQETMDLAQSLKEKVLEHDHFETLSNDEVTLLETFEGKRLFLSRIAIIANQSRIPLGLPGFTKAQLEKLIEGLIEKGYVESADAPADKVYFLTERGKYRVQ